MLRATLRIVAGLLLGVMIAWLIQDLRSPDDPKEIAKHAVQISVCGENIPEGLYERLKKDAEDRWVRDYLENLKHRHPHEDTVNLMLAMCFWATIFGSLTTYSLLLDYKQTGFLQKRREEMLWQRA